MDTRWFIVVPVESPQITAANQAHGTATVPCPVAVPCHRRSRAGWEAYCPPRRALTIPCTSNGRRRLLSAHDGPANVTPHQTNWREVRYFCSRGLVEPAIALLIPHSLFLLLPVERTLAEFFHQGPLGFL